MQAVKWLHIHGWGHGDIRWENVIMETERAFRLIDLEAARRLGTDCSHVVPPLRAWGENGEALEDGVFTARSDLYMIGTLMSQANVSDEAGKKLMAALLNKSISTDAALAHDWLKDAVA